MFVLKDIPSAIFLHFHQEIWPQLRKGQNAFLRLPFDTILQQQVLVYEYLTDDLHKLVGEKRISKHASRQILKATLKGIAEQARAA